MADKRFHGMGAQRKVFAPSANSDCLCGSGKKFKRCCSGNLPGFDIGKKAKAVAKIGNYTEALLAYRSDISQYTIWHKTNTAPLLTSADGNPPQQVIWLLDTDIGALADHIGSLSWCYAKLNRSEEFPAVLERLRSNIAHPRWQRKITYLQTIEALQSSDWNEEVGRRELKKLGAMDAESDVEILQLYIDLLGEQLGLAERQKLVDRVIQLTRSEAERLHYRAVKAVDYLLVGDVAGAEAELQAAVEAFSGILDKYKDSGYAMSYYAMAISLLGNLKNDSVLWDKSLAVGRELLARDDWTASGRAALYIQQGDVLRRRCAWSEAKDSYLSALKEGRLEICKIFIAECLLYLDGPIAAQEMLNTVDRECLTPPNLLTMYLHWQLYLFKMET
jgi:tetratricopeptide (TPR) repeat protein